MKYIIVDGITGCDCGGSICHAWNTMQDYRTYINGIGRKGGYYQGNDNKIRALLLFDIEPLKNDIYNLSYVQAEAEKNMLDDSSKAARMLAYYISVNESKNLPLICRTIELAISEAEHATYILSRMNIHDNMSLANYLVKKPEYIIELRVNDNFSDTSIVHMRNAIHDYIVARVLWEWAKLTYPKFADYWFEKMQADLATIKEEVDKGDYDVNARIMPAW